MSHLNFFIQLYIFVAYNNKPLFFTVSLVLVALLNLAGFASRLRVSCASAIWAYRVAGLQAVDIAGTNFRPAAVSHFGLQAEVL